MTNTNRRSFLAASASAMAASRAALAYAAPRLANDRIQVGVIGLGSRGYNLVDDLLRHHAHARIVAVCDVDQNHYRDRKWGQGKPFGLIPGQAKVAEGYSKLGSATEPKSIAVSSDYRDLIARDDIDAVVIATPDHWHALCTMGALREGKDVYCEKPVTHLFAEGQMIYREVKNRKAVFQTGSQQRSDWRFRRAVELVRNGLLGNMQRFEVGLPPGYSAPQGDAKVLKTPKQLDYDFWCGPAEVLPYMRARHHRWWRGHRAYGGGVLMDWIGHHNDIAHWAIDVDRSGPTRVEAVNWSYPDTEVYNTPHHYTIRSEYSGGIVGKISSKMENGLKLVGDEGWVYVNRGKLKASDERWVKQEFQPGPKRVIASDDHMQNFLACVRERTRCIAPAETAHRSITPGHLAYVSNALGQPLEWNAEAESTGNADADAMLGEIDYRGPWTLH